MENRPANASGFKNLKGLGILVWKTDQQTRQVSKNLTGLGKGSFSEIDVEVLDKNANPIGEKTFYNLPNDLFLSNWIVKPKANKQEVISLSNVVNPAKATSGSTKWSDGAIAHLVCDSNDFQNANLYTLLLSSAQGIGHKGAIYVTPENLWQAAIVSTVRRVIKPTWLNDRDQFLQPTKPLTNEFKTDCLIWMLFNGSNLTASADGLEWNGKTWSIVNHFIPFTEAEVGSPDRFESDFMVQYLQDLSGLSYEVLADENG
ncbi:MAG: hypothetical protein QM541_15210 [Flavobacterium sp.]|nr:hypothetical protein [Flavobacterium sp.]